MNLTRSNFWRGAAVLCDVVRVVELIWLGQQLTEIGRSQLQANAPGVPRHELVVMADLIENAPSTITDIAQRPGYVQSRVSAAWPAWPPGAGCRPEPTRPTAGG